ncbi:hypothetical protein VZ95_18470 [Elstera litoralis]|uniref:Ribbon-helix-helix domain-containing protein n=1 Tax=Elstera litoralis TaxID=552518 RepID=A0A0F3INK0_9PROT|nr:hypothetical protein VZ95_18470 [Elstera litoralis]
MARLTTAPARPMATHRSLRRFTLSSGPIDLRLETELWSALAVIANDRRIPLASLIDTIDQQRGVTPLNRAIWRFTIAYLRALTELAEVLPPAEPRQRFAYPSLRTVPAPAG